MMGFRLIDWVAILGALAWTPHLISVIKQWLLKPKIRVITQKNAEIGFSTFGPVFNVRLALAVENKDIVISNMKIILTHESGDCKHFEWQSITQHVGKMTTPDSSEMPFVKENTVLAIKLNQKEIEERFIRYQDPKFIEEKWSLEKTALNKMSYLKDEAKFDGQQFLREPEMAEIYRFIKQSFSWKQGKYTARIEIESPEKFVIIDNVRKFYLSHLDVEMLSKNLDMIEKSYQESLLGEVEQDDKVSWQWCFPKFINPS